MFCTFSLFFIGISVIGQIIEAASYPIIAYHYLFFVFHPVSASLE
jgi:hypothetical protein